MKTRFQWLALCLGLLCLGCSPDENGTPSSLTIGVLPDERSEALQHRYDPLIAYLEEALEIDARLVIPKDYAELVARFGSGDLDLAYFGAATFVSAHVKYGAVPLVMRDIDTEFTSYFLARSDDPTADIEGFRGREFAFGSELSTSGHLMPRFFLLEQGITPEEFFAGVQFSGAHDTTAAWVRDGMADLGAANAEVVDTMLRDGRLNPNALRIVWRTPPYADYVWAVRPGLDQDLQRRLLDAFLALSPADRDQAAVLQRMGAGGFLPARAEEFARLQQVMTDLPQFQDMLEAGPK